MPAALTGVILNSFEWSSMSGDDEFSMEPGVFTGLTTFLGAGANVSFSESGQGWAYSSVTPNIVFRLPSDLPVTFAVWAGYQFAVPGNDQHEAEGGAPHDHGVEQCGPEFGPDAPPCDQGGPPHDHGSHSHGAGGHTHTGVHRHGTSGLFTRFIIDARLSSQDRLVLNLINFITPDGKPGTGYAAGYRHEFSHDFSTSLEITGDFGAGASHQALGAIQAALVSHLSIRLGVGFGLTPTSPDFSIHSSVLWRF